MEGKKRVTTEAGEDGGKERSAFSFCKYKRGRGAENNRGDIKNDAEYYSRYYALRSNTLHHVVYQRILLVKYHNNCIILHVFNNKFAAHTSSKHQ